jgi:hypothetical protein
MDAPTTYASRSIHHVLFPIFDYMYNSICELLLFFQDKLKERGLLSDDAFEKRKEAAVDMFIKDMSRLASEALEVQAVKPKRRGDNCEPTLDPTLHPTLCTVSGSMLIVPVVSCAHRTCCKLCWSYLRVGHI